MKKNYLLTILMILASLGSFAQLGTTDFNTATDVGSSYTSATWTDGSNLGTGLSTWTLTKSATNSGRYVGATAQGTDSFGLYSENSGNFSAAERNLTSDLRMGETFSVNVAHTATINGEVFVQFLDDGVPVFTLKFVGGDDRWRMNDGGSDFDSGQLYSANTSLAFSFTYNEDGTYSYTFGSGSGNNIAAVNTISGINSVKFQSSNQGGSQNFGVNNLSINSKYTIPTGLSIASDQDLTVPYIDVQSGGTLNIGNTSGLLITGNLNVSGTLNIATGSSLRINGTSTGNITYNVNVTDDKWHLISSPVVGESYGGATTWIVDNAIKSGTTDANNRGISTYDNGTPDGTTDHWRYYNTVGGTETTFGSGTGYSLKRTSAGNYSFTGTYPEGTITPSISTNTNNWNMIGNPYPSFIDIAAFITENTTTNDYLADAFPSVYVWNASTTSYDDLTTGYIHPGQAFFINSKVDGNASITEAMQSHQTMVPFYKSSTTSIKLILSDGTSTKNTKINYLDGKTASLDKGFDIGMFDGVASDLRVYTYLIENNKGIAFARQALPSSDIETTVVPVGVKAAANTEITFSAEALNLPSGIKVFLEDKIANTFTRLDEANNEYKVTLTDAVNGVGRFYLYTTQSALSIKDVVLNGVNIFKSDASTIRISGLPLGKASVSLFNILGKQVLTTSFETNGVKDISLPKLATGVYFAKVQTETGKISKKIILE